MERYTKELAHNIGVLIYGTAQVYDANLDEVCEEAWRILNAVPNPKGLFEERWLKE